MRPLKKVQRILGIQGDCCPNSGWRSGNGHTPQKTPQQNGTDDQRADREDDWRSAKRDTVCWSANFEETLCSRPSFVCRGQVNITVYAEKGLLAQVAFTSTQKKQNPKNLE